MKKIFFTSIPVAASLLLVLSLFAFVPLSTASDFFLHSATNDFLNNTSPTATTAKFKDSAAVNRTIWREIGTWIAAPMATVIKLNSLSDLRVWIGLKNSDDEGTYFDLRAELTKNGVVLASGETKTIQGVTRNPSNAKEVTVSFGAISDNQFNPGDVLSLRILTKVADSGGHNNAVGLRLYYDAVSRPSRFGAVFEDIAVTEIIPPEGGTIQLQGFASVAFPPGSFPSNNPVKVSATATAETHEDFSRSAEGPRLPYEIRINTGNTPPVTSFDVSLHVPASFVSSLPPDHHLQVFIYPLETSTEETIGQFVGYRATFDPTTNTLQARLPADAFTDALTPDDTWEAILVVGVVPRPGPGGIQGSSAENPIRSAKAERTMIASISLLGLLFASTPPRICEGSPLGNPLDRFPAEGSRFRPPGHTGTDYPGTLGENVHPVASGTVTAIGFDLVKLPKPDPRSKLLIKGYGHNVIITHADGSQTRYGHLVPGSTDHLVVGQSVTPTTIIGELGVSGGVTGPHLHLEYSPTGNVRDKSSLVDPHPCLEEGMEPLAISPQNPTLTCPNGSVSFTASGGTPPYTWSTTRGQIIPSPDTTTATLTPPENNPKVSGNAYIQYGGSVTYQNPNCTQGVCQFGSYVIYSCNESKSGNFSACTQTVGCAGPPYPLVCNAINGAKQCYNAGGLPPCDSGIGSGTAPLDYLLNHPRSGAICDARSEVMKELGCKPCIIEMQGTTITVTDGAGNPPVTVPLTLK